MKKLLSLLTAVILFVLFALSVNAVSEQVTDRAEIFSATAKAQLESKARRIKNEYSTDIVILTVSDIHKSDAEKYVRKFYENECSGDTGGGVVLFISMMPDDRNYYILTEGTAADVYENYVGKCQSLVVKSLSAGDYEKAAFDFLSYTENVLSGDSASGSAYTLSKSNGNYFVKYLLISVGIAFVIALITVLIMRSRMKTIRPAREANNYIVDGSVFIRDKSIIFVRSHVSKTKRSTDNSSGGGHSSGHYGGGGGSF